MRRTGFGWKIEPNCLILGAIKFSHSAVEGAVYTRKTGHVTQFGNGLNTVAEGGGDVPIRNGRLLSYEVKKMGIVT